LLLYILTKRLRKASYYLVINLAISDMIMMHCMGIFIYNSFHGGPAAGSAWCTYYGFFSGFSGTTAIMTIAMMAAERYVCVSRPLDPSSRMTKSRALIIVISIWIYALVFSSMPLFGINRYVPEGFLTSCSFDYLSDTMQDRIFVLSFFAAAYCVPMIIICRCYIGIVLSFNESQRLFILQTKGLRSRSKSIENQRNLEVKLIKISFYLISLWTIAWTPYAIVALLGVFGEHSALTPMNSMIPALFCKVASLLDPFMYGLSNKEFKKEFIRKLLSINKGKKFRAKQIVTSFLMRRISTKSHDATISDDNADLSSFDGPLDVISPTEERHSQLFVYSLQDQLNHLSNHISHIANSKPPSEIPSYRSLMKQQAKHKQESLELNIIHKAHDHEPEALETTYSRNTSQEKTILDGNDNAVANNSVGVDGSASNVSNSKLVKEDASISLKSMQVFPIPQIYMIETYSDVIRFKSRRSF
ncbi:opsin, ultraviolet-sensitive-like, partial [Uloborus diversus]|uniref:opsin, ultraviolet-sensitive-like n=1 Tax=Uloborus diversus TaxID=327109 RepID=UPI00240964B4